MDRGDLSNPSGRDNWPRAVLNPCQVTRKNSALKQASFGQKTDVCWRNLGPINFLISRRISHRRNSRRIRLRRRDNPTKSSIPAQIPVTYCWQETQSGQLASFTLRLPIIEECIAYPNNEQGYYQYLSNTPFIRCNPAWRAKTNGYACLAAWAGGQPSSERGHFFRRQAVLVEQKHQPREGPHDQEKLPLVFASLEYPLPVVRFGRAPIGGPYLNASGPERDFCFKQLLPALGVAAQHDHRQP